MPSDFTAVNHYVPQWYQQQFIPGTQLERKYHYLDLAPERVAKTSGGFYMRHELRRLGPASCFEQEHLYTLRFGSHASDVIEKRFFGRIDDRGARAIEFFKHWEFNEQSHDMVHDLLAFLDAQKLRTPKGLDVLKTIAGSPDNQATLQAMRRLWQMHITIWMEGIWEVFECEASPTKLIVTDHPVATYNKGSFPLSSPCKYPHDASIAALGTHTLFPLGPDHLLVITNLGFVRNPWVNPIRQRENPRAFADTMFDVRHIQTGRQLTEEQVITANFILKSRARRFIAAPEREWLYPERQMRTTMWNKLGDQFFPMPDPRKVAFSTQILVGYQDGGAWGMDEYGRQDPEYDPKVKRLRDIEWDTFQKHKSLWDNKFGKLTRDELLKYF